VTKRKPLPFINENGAGPSGTHSSSRTTEQTLSPVPKRSPIPESVWDRRILPTHLCVKDDRRKEGYECVPVDNLVQDKASKDFEFAFISYSRKQFFTQSEDEIQAWKESAAKEKKPWSRSDEGILRNQIAIDRNCITRIALKAIEDSGLNAFYIDFECVDPTTMVKKGKDANAFEKKAGSFPPTYPSRF